MPAAPDPPLLRACWPAPPTVLAFASTRLGGHSRRPFDSLNLATHVGDEPDAVAANRAALALALPAFAHWQDMRQLHGTEISRVSAPRTPPRVDALITTRPGLALAVATADCLPVLMCNRDGTQVAAVHAGWRGLADGILGQAVNAFAAAAQDLLAWIGPRIGPRSYQVGGEVRARFLDEDPSLAACFADDGTGRWQADLPAIAIRRLRAAGVGTVFDSGYCSYSNPAFFSYRRDGETGRQWSVIGLLAAPQSDRSGDRLGL